MGRAESRACWVGGILRMSVWTEQRFCLVAKVRANFKTLKACSSKIDEMLGAMKRSRVLSRPLAIV